MYNYCRLFYRLCRASINSSDYDVQRVPWFDNIRAFSFAHNVHIASQWRSKQERRTAPVVLDMAFTEWLLPGSSMDLTVLPETAEYFRVRENSRLKNPGTNVRVRRPDTADSADSAVNRSVCTVPPRRFHATTYRRD
jgi:hypothetical protein